MMTKWNKAKDNPAIRDRIPFPKEKDTLTDVKIKLPV
jgi:hypothetical protein